MKIFECLKKTVISIMFLALGAIGLMGAESPLFKKLPNGLEVILIENHSSPVVASFFVVKVGLRSENEDSCGISHMLEHLLFNGTEHRTQKQLYDDVDMLGVYNNAFTRDDFTCFMMVSPKENFPQALAIQEDMVFHSMLLPKKLEKERGIVLEELAKDMVSNSYLVETKFKNWLYENTPYAMPVLGTKESIKKMPRDAIWNYYKSHYVPNNTALLVVGDLDKTKTFNLIKKRLGGYSFVKLPHVKPIKNIFKRKDFSKTIKVPIPSTRLVLTLPAPSMNSKNYFPFEIASLWIEDKNTSPLLPLIGKHNIAAISGEYRSNKDFSIYNLTFQFKPHTSLSLKQINKIRESLNNLANIKIDPQLLKSYKISRNVNEIYDFENVHYLGMFKGETIADVPFVFLKQYFPPMLIKLVNSVSTSEVNYAIKKLFSYSDPIITVMVPADKNGAKTKHFMGGMR